MLCHLFSTNNRGLNVQLTDLQSIFVQVFDIGSYQLKVILILETRPEFAHSAIVCVQLHDVLVVAGHTKSCALHWYDLVHEMSSEYAKIIISLGSPDPELPKMK
jgi:hypothetical protein